MATNAGGWPYPIGTEFLKDGDNAVKALADKANERLGSLAVRGGQANVTVAANNRAKVIFPDVTISSCICVAAIPVGIIFTLTNLEGAVAGVQRSAALFQMTDWNGTNLANGAAVAFYYVAVGTYAGPP